MSKFKPGDRVRGVHVPDILGTVKYTDHNGVFIEVDVPVSAEIDGNKTTSREGYVDENLIELVESSDWASIWDKNST